MRKKPLIAILSNYPVWLHCNQIPMQGGHYGVWHVAMHEAFAHNDEFEIHRITLDKSVKKQIEEINDEMEIYKSNYLERLKKIKKNDYWINHFKRNKKIKRITKEVINELIDKIYVYENSKIKIVFKYQDEFVSLMKTVEEGSVTECQSYGIMDCI